MGSLSKGMIESRLSSADYENANLEMLPRSGPLRKCTTSLEGSYKTPVYEDVQELLECPVCMTIMYPPIYQVYFSNISYKLIILFFEKKEKKPRL